MPKPVPVQATPRDKARPRAPTLDGVLSEPDHAPGVELCLTIGRQGVGFELARPRAFGPLVVTELAATLRDAHFPIDVSGGVARFRHRRSTLERLTIELRAEQAARAAAPRLRGLLAPRTPGLRLLVRADGAVVCVYETEDVATLRARPRKVLAFDIVIEPRGAAVALHVVRARAFGTREPAAALALAASQALLGGFARREGACFVVEDPCSRIARALLPDAGARAPDASLVRWTALTATGDAWILHASDGREAAPSPDAVRARETTALLARVDDALAQRALDKARAAALEVLEFAPAHAEACARIAQIDVCAGGRVEAALATLADARPTTTADRVLIPLLYGALYLDRGDAQAAITALVGAAEAEPAPELAGAALVAAAAATTDPHEALARLDLAVTRDQASASVRWARVARRLEIGLVTEATADVEHLEAIARGPVARHAVWRAAAETWAGAGLARVARGHWERALRYEPDDPETQLGLARALLASHDPGEPWAVARAIALLTRAQEALCARATADTRQDARVGGASRMVAGELADCAAVDLARALATLMGDRPAAIARLHGIRDGADVALEARGLEAHLRAELGDVVGASLVWARLRDLALARPDGAPGPREVLDRLLEGATFERERGDLRAAQSHLAAALHLAPTDAGVLAAYRTVGAALARDARGVCEPPVEVEQAAAPPDPAQLELRAETLARRYQATPDDDTVAAELGDVLAQLGRAHELLALLFGRLESTDEARRVQLSSSARQTLTRLEAKARAAGRTQEADVYAEGLAALQAP